MMTVLSAGDTITFNYKGSSELRTVVYEDTKKAKHTGNTVIVGRDEGRDNKYRSFNIKHITNLALVGVAPVPAGWDVAQTSVS